MQHKLRSGDEQAWGRLRGCGGAGGRPATQPESKSS